MSMTGPSPEQIEQIFDRFIYDRSNGLLRDTSHRVEPTVKNGYLCLFAAGQQWSLHRLIWLAETDEWPTGQIRFKDRDRHNTTFENLYRPSPGIPKPKKGPAVLSTPEFEQDLWEAEGAVRRCASPEDLERILLSWRPVDLLIFN